MKIEKTQKLINLKNYCISCNYFCYQSGDRPRVFPLYVRKAILDHELNTPTTGLNSLRCCKNLNTEKINSINADTTNANIYELPNLKCPRRNCFFKSGWVSYEYGENPVEALNRESNNKLIALTTLIVVLTLFLIGITFIFKYC